ncbi:MAG: glycosyltransferase family 2 protein, partial [Lentisphaeria bacterium]|nr:glycosyltransferase family 2 protein [Lentisphaeria bacterium]
VVIPIYNESENIDKLYLELVAALQSVDSPFEIIFIDDGSTDGSLQTLETLQANDKRISIIQLRRNFGKAAAYNAGFEHTSGDIVITMDTDLQDDPDEIPLFIEQIDRGFDMVCGWKHKGKGSMDKSLPSKLFNRVVRAFTGISLHDFNCPFKAYRREVLDEIDVYGELHRYIPVLAVSRGFTVAEVKIKNMPRTSGESKYGFERYMRGMLDLLTVLFITRFAKRPLHFLGLAGLIFCSTGFAILSFLLGAHVLYNFDVLTDPTWNIHNRPMLTLGLLLLIMGAQFFSIGLLAELLITMNSSSGNGYSVKKIGKRS